MRHRFDPGTVHTLRSAYYFFDNFHLLSPPRNQDSGGGSDLRTAKPVEMSTTDSKSGISNCYVFKSRLQEYAQKVGLPIPVYETIKEGPAHEPLFRSTVIVNDIRYDSLLGFSSRKASEQSAAEIAVIELAKSGHMNQSISQPVQETGLCKNLLQEYTQKMHYAVPTYECKKVDKPNRMTFFSCSVEVGGVQYIGAAAKTKKEAEIKAARTALLALQSTESRCSDLPDSDSQLTVVPSKRKSVEDSGTNQVTAKRQKKKKKEYFKNLKARNKYRRKKAVNIGKVGNVQGNIAITATEVGANLGGSPIGAVGNLPDEKSMSQNERGINATEYASGPHNGENIQYGQQIIGPNVNKTYPENAGSVIAPTHRVNISALVMEDNKVSGVTLEAPTVTNSTVDQQQSPVVLSDLGQPVCGSCC